MAKKVKRDMWAVVDPVKQEVLLVRPTRSRARDSAVVQATPAVVRRCTVSVW